jgi:hypothetical protein
VRADVAPWRQHRHLGHGLRDPGAVPGAERLGHLRIAGAEGRGDGREDGGRQPGAPHHRVQERRPDLAIGGHELRPGIDRPIKVVRGQDRAIRRPGRDAAVRAAREDGDGLVQLVKNLPYPRVDGGQDLSRGGVRAVGAGDGHLRPLV